MGDNKLNTAEYDRKGRCVRHPAIRLRKKKFFGGWKIIIGHCPECCLDEMRRVRDEIGAEQDGDNDRGRDGDHHRSREGGKRERKKKKKRSDRDRHRDRGDRERRSRDHGKGPPAADSSSEVGSEGYQRASEARHHNNHGRGKNHPQSIESEATSSTGPNHSIEFDGNGSVVSDPYIPQYQDQHNGVRGHQQHSPTHHHHPQQQQQQQQQYHQHQQQSPAQIQRTMVLSMAFADPRTGQRGTYTGQVNSINHKPDGKGTVYYANGSIAEGSWMNGMLVENEEDHGGSGGGYGQRVQGGGDGGGVAYPPPQPVQNRTRSLSRSRAAHGGHHQAAPMQRSRSFHRPRMSNQGDSNQFNGKLHLLDQLGGAHPTLPRGAAMSVGSFGSRGSNQNQRMQSSSSVQDYTSGYGGRSVGSLGSSGGERRDPRYRQQQPGPQRYR